MIKWNILLLSILSTLINYSLVAFADSDCSFNIPECSSGESVFLTGQNYNECQLDYVCGNSNIPRIVEVIQSKDYFRVDTNVGGRGASPKNGYLVEYWFAKANEGDTFVPLNDYAFGTDSQNSNAVYGVDDRDGIWRVPLPSSLSNDKTWVNIVLLCIDPGKCETGTSHRYRAIYNINNPISQECSDSDGGRDYSIVGTISGCFYSASQGYSNRELCGVYRDECIGTYTLLEHYCYTDTDGEKLLAPDRYYCPNGCKDGVCKELPILQPIPGRTLFVVYEKASVDDIKLMMRLRDHLKEQKFITNEEYSQKTYLGNEAFRPDLAGKVTTFIYKNNALIVVDDQADAEYIKLASSISSFLREIGANPLPTKTVSELGHPSLTQSIIQLLDGQNSGEKPEAQCLDSDGGLDSKAKGTVMAYGVEYIDHCARGGESSQLSGGAAKAGDVIEYACNGSGGEPLCGSSYCRYKVLPCPSEFSCVDGACARIQCMDSDNGKDPFSRGVTRGDLNSIGRKGEISESADFCVQSNNGDYPYAHDPDGGRYISRKSQVVSCENDCA